MSDDPLVVNPMEAGSDQIEHRVRLARMIECARRVAEAYRLPDVSELLAGAQEIAERDAGLTASATLH